jgi:alkylhydroperoxidase family enzyme
VIGHSPPLLRAWLDFAWPLRLHARTSRKLRELLILRGAQVSGTQYEWVHHAEMARAAGVSQAQIDAIEAGDTCEASVLFDPAEKAVLRLAAEVTRGPAASAASIDALRRSGFDEAGIVELTLTASFYVCVARFLQSMGVELEAGQKAR